MEKATLEERGNCSHMKKNILDQSYKRDFCTGIA